MKKALTLLTLLWLAGFSGWAQTVTAWEQPAPQTVVFTADDGARLGLTFCSPDVIRVEYAFDGVLAQEAPTPAVVNAQLEPVSVSVDEAPSLYEIFTGPVGGAV